MKRAIVYTRFSPQRNAAESESCETQQAYCEQYAHDHDMDIAEVFEDRGVSGSSEDRPLLWSALDELQKGDVLLVYKMDRLARDVYLAECIRRAVDKAGAKIVAIEGDAGGDTPEQIMIRQVLAAMAEYERKIIAIRTKHAMRHHQTHGRRMGRFAPYGYKIDPEDNRRLIPDEAELPSMAMVIALHKQGKTPHEIVVHMNKEGKELARGTIGWTQRTIGRIIDKS